MAGEESQSQEVGFSSGQIAGDKLDDAKIGGDKVDGDKFGGDKVAGDKYSFTVSTTEQAIEIAQELKWSWPTAWDFRPYREEKRKGFVGRSWLFEDVRAWALDTDPQAPQALLIAADYGVGKSAFLAELLATDATSLPILAHHFCTSEQEATLTPELFVRSLAAQLANALPAYRQALEFEEAKELRQWLDEATQDPSRAFDQAVLAPLLSIQPPPTSMLWVVDALDEAQELKAGMRAGPHITIVQLLARYASRLPGWIKVLATSRRRPDVLTPLRQAFSLKELNAEEARNLEDLYSYTLARCSRPPLSELLKQAGLNAEEAARILSSEEQSSGKFLYVVRVLNDLASGQLTLHSRGDLEQLPPGMEGFYQDAFERRFPTDDSYEPVRNILGVLCEQREPLGTPELASILDVSERQIQEWLKPMHDLLRLVSRTEEIDGQTRQSVHHSFDHISLPQWLSEVDEWGYPRADRFSLDLASGAERIRSWALKEAHAGRAHTWPYLVRHLSSHLYVEERSGVMAELLGEFAWLEARLRLAGINALLGDFTLATPSPWLGRLERALRQGAYVLRHNKRWKGSRHLASQLLGRLADDGEEAERFKGQAAAWLQRSGGAQPLTASLVAHEALLSTLPVGRPVMALAVLCDGRLASGTINSTIHIWDPDAGSIAAFLRGHLGFVSELVGLPDGRLVSGSSDSTIRLWDPANGSCERVFEGHQGTITALAVLPESLLASASVDKTIRIWNLNTGSCLAVLKGHKEIVSCIVVLPNGMIVSGSADGSICIWDPNTSYCPQVLYQDKGWVTALALHPDGHLLAGLMDGTIIVLDHETCTSVRSYVGHLEGIASLVALPNGWVASASLDSSIRIWDNDTDTCRAIFEGHLGEVNKLVLLPSGNLVSGSSDSTIRLWDPAKERFTQVFEGHHGRIKALVFLGNGRLASGSLDSTIRIWDPMNRSSLAVVCNEKGGVCSLELLPDGRLAAGSLAISIWDLATGSSTVLDGGHGRGSVNALVKLPNRRLASGSSDCTICIWDLATGTCKAIFRDHHDDVTALAMLSDGRLASSSVASAHDDSAIRFWDLSTGSCSMVINVGADALAVLPNGRLISGGQSVCIWDPVSGHCVAEQDVGYGSVMCMAVLPNGRVAVGLSDHTIYLLDPDNLDTDPQVLFVADAAITALVSHPTHPLLVAGDVSGRLHWLQLETH